MSWFEGARIAVTGAAGGIGQVTCEVLRERGARVFALDRAETDAGEYVACDVTDEDSVEQAVARIQELAGGVDGLVAAAGVVEDDVAAEEMSAAEFDRVLGVNLRGVFLCCTAFGRAMLAEGAGRIVTVSSMSGNHVVNVPQKQCAYNASKAGVSALTRSLAVEWTSRGVRVNTIAPGYVRTSLLDLKQHQFDGWLSNTPAGRFAQPAEIAKAIAWLLSDEADFCCGSELLIDGGYSLA
ncbi:NAD(P)-dependent dehydrogenase (short-subunit alcohol dehydrogenase family) [Tamaricihabitans halophyticus]|uniref:NAD(P)-dependent dehydrogenase (Short-subunit alcohol dehydrogenase family) n=1 Tax=Tamaricihabitans halophyticus TaxID=1262583 RepID=A0A4R2QX42_9PSEU|nr:SDR family oxidoreductase [Tamaricihabitans halophyticus]TCP54287.1 NAD(P)-dependent dehydrogenase (short-subunit alcohol dehydrogenase family) [Tamaricihabitans halophyticus]